MSSIIPRDNELSKLDDMELVNRISTSGALNRTKLLHELFFRRVNSDELNALLMKSIVDEKNRKEIFFGFIKVAWIPSIDILELGNAEEVGALKTMLKNEWSENERRNFYEYVKKDFDVHDIL
jgi:hypothetical protein